MAPNSRADDQYRPMAVAELHALLDAAVDAIVVIDEGGRVTTFNKAAERLFGYSAADVIGQDISILMGEPDRTQHAGHLARYRSTG